MQRCLLTSYPYWGFGSKTHPRFHEFLGGLIKLSIYSSCTWSYVLLNEKKKKECKPSTVRKERERGHEAKFRENNRQASKGLLVVSYKTHLIPAATRCNNTCETFLIRETHWSLRIQGFLWGLLTGIPPAWHVPQKGKKILNICHIIV